MDDKTAQASLADIAVASGHIGYHWDLKADHLIWFGEWAQLFGADRAHPPHNAETFATAIMPEDQYLVFGGSNASIDREYRLRLPDGKLIWVHEHGTIDHEAGRAIRQRGLLRLIQGPQRRAHVASDTVLERDPLTGRPNRAYMQAQIHRLLVGPKDIRQLSAYLVISIDKMAFVNEAIGTKAADDALCNVADRLANLLPTKALLSRVSGDTFGVLLPGIARDLNPLLQRIVQTFRDHPVLTTTTPFHITVSSGAVRFADLTDSMPEIMIHAEQALHEARQRGRNQYVEYQESAARARETRATLELVERVKKALKHDGVRLAFQPIIETESGQVLFYEALARLMSDDGKPIAAADFIPVVEQQGLALEFDRHVLNMAVHELEQHKQLRLAVNISGLTAAHGDWPEYVDQLLSKKLDIARRLIIEITETAAVMDVTETRRFAEQLQKMGGQIALDDFGAGFTSIRHLRGMSVSIMKIDRELLTNIIGNTEQEHLVRMLISIAKGLNLKTVAEGVETEAVANWLRQEKVDMMQGYYFGRPSLERPWLALKGAHAPAERAQTLLGKSTNDKTGHAELRVASVLRV